MGSRIGLAWEPISPLRIETGLSMRRFSGWEIATEMGILWLPLRVGGWRLAAGVLVEIAYGAGVTASRWDLPAPATWPAGPFLSAALGVTLSPIELRFPRFDVSILRLTTLFRRGPDRFAVSLGSTVFALSVPFVADR